MKVKVTPYKDLAKVQKDNPYVKWGNLGVENTDEKLACTRLKNNDVFVAGGKSKFDLSKNDTFFMIGSCFARGLENILLSRNLKVASHTEDFLKWRTVKENVTPLGATNRYNTASIANDFLWHIDGKKVFPEEAFLETKNGIFTDPHMNPTLAPGEISELKERRAIWKTVFDRIPDVDVVILTLGLVEAWYDHKTNLVLNSAPDPRAIRRDSERFSFVKLGSQDNLDNLNEIHRLLKSVCKPDFRIIVTVSPVPLMRTFTDQDIVVANQYSKNCLRTAAQEFTDQHDNVAYFPSYEIALNSNPQLAWEQSDLRHVQGSFSKEIMKQFFDMYFKDIAFEGSKYSIKRLF